MFGNIPLVKFDDHDLANEETFPNLVPELYLEQVLYDNVPKFESMPWAHGLHVSGILNLLRIPYFGKYPITSMCVR